MTDMDGCFYGNTTKTILNKYGVKLYSSKNVEIKSSLVENRIKLLKFSIFNYITQNNTFNYTKDLSEIVFRAFLVGVLTTCMNACVAGSLIPMI